MMKIAGWLALWGLVLTSFFLTACIKDIYDVSMLVPLYDKEKELKIPPNATSIAFMQGRWKSYGLANSDSREVAVDTTFEFDAAGQGRSVEREHAIAKNAGDLFKNRAKESCNGEATASLVGDAVVIHNYNIVCPSGKRYVNQTITCKEESMLGMVCRGIQPAGAQFAYKLVRE